MTIAYIGPDPEAKSLRCNIIDKDVMDAVAYALKVGAFTSTEVHHDAGLEDLLHGNGRVVGHLGSSSPRYYKHKDDPEWAIIFNTDCPGDAERGRIIIEPLTKETEEKP